MTKVRFEDTGQGLDAAVTAMFEAFGGGKAMLKPSRDVFIKVNGIDFKPHVFTSPEVVGAAVRYFRRQGARNVYVIENSTQGNFTRLVYEICGMKKMCEETGAIPVYLDETAEIPMFLPRLEAFIQIPDFVHEHLIRKRSDNLYISIPKLKSHSMTTVTLGIKNQFGLVHQKSRIADHNFKLHQKLADIYANIRPDFTLIDGIEATNYGHYPALALKDQCVVPLNVLIGGDDPLAVDIVGSKFLGFDLKEVEHLKLAAKYGLGESRISKIEIVNKALFDERRQSFSWNLLEKFPPEVKIVRGKTMCCTEGCKRNTEALLEVLSQDFKGKGSFTIFMGKGIDRADIEGANAPVHIAGDCAIGECYQELCKRLGRSKVTTSPGCNNLAANLDGMMKWLHITPLKLVPVNPIKSLKLLILAKLHGTKANIPPVIKI
ncbi:MAG TPA: DUF362 domain-containing protein [Deltaproteobacteria bacterium]|nr:DUF362 domain-containing protein [Deltaproteobacteria bacterium]HQI00218.1 DUF362 domain-containing protein [Deltaproteobacteria bacterium]